MKATLFSGLLAFALTGTSFAQGGNQNPAQSPPSQESPATPAQKGSDPATTDQNKDKKQKNNTKNDGTVKSDDTRRPPQDQAPDPNNPEKPTTPTTPESPATPPAR